MTLFVGSQEQTIIAQCTPQGSGALALLRLSGDQAWSIASKISRLSGNKILIEQASHTVHHGFVYTVNGQELDEVMLILMRGPKTFTGEDVVEITCHNNPLIIHHIINHACSLGARIAQAGEFSRRAVMYKKLDLTQAEAIYDLIHAQTEQALKFSLSQVKGSLSSFSADLERELIALLAWCEASFEFLDEGGDFSDELSTRLQTILDSLHDVQRSFNNETLMRQGMRIALLGSVNAGKSSIFNALIGQKRAIVTAIAGTTRDSIEATITRQGVTWTLVDTAGLRSTDDIVEKEGIERSLQEAALADLVLIVIDQSRAMTSQEYEIYTKLCDEYRDKSFILYNKADLAAAPQQLSIQDIKTLTISNQLPATIENLEQELLAWHATLTSGHSSPYLLTKRQRSVIESIDQKLGAITPLLKASNISYELISYHIRDALEQLTELTGRSVSEAGLNQVFKEFCIGK